MHGASGIVFMGTRVAKVDEQAIAEILRKERTMSPAKRSAKKQAKARPRCRLKAQERLEQDRRQAQRAAEALQSALEDLGLPENLVAEIEGRLRSQQKLLSKICGVMFPSLFGCRINTELCRVRG